MGLFYSRGTPVTESVIKQQPELECSQHQKEAIGLCIQKGCSKALMICSQCMTDADGHRCSMLSLESVKESIKAFVEHSDPRVKEVQTAIKQYYDGLRQFTSRKIQQKYQQYLRSLEQYLFDGQLSGSALDVYRWVRAMDLTNIEKAGRQQLPNIMKVINSKQAEIAPEQLETILSEIHKPDEKAMDELLALPSISKQLDKLLGLAAPIVRPVISYAPNQLPSKVLSEQQDKDNFVTIFDSNLSRFKRLDLLYRASEHGFSAVKFHELSHGSANTFVLAKGTNNEVFGGYTPCRWVAAETSYAVDLKGESFLFSITKLKVYGLRKDMLETAIHNSEDLGPTFGRGHDLLLSNKCNEMVFSHSNLGKSYQCPEEYGSSEARTLLAGSGNFLVTDYEVWHLS